MNCRHCQSRLLDYLDGDLHGKQAQLLMAHVASCEACSTALQDLRQFDHECNEHLVAPAAAYTQEELLALMAEVTPMEDTAPLLPTLPVKQHAPRVAAAALFLMAAGNIPSLRMYSKAGAQYQQGIEARQARVEVWLDELGLPAKKSQKDAEKQA